MTHEKIRARLYAASWNISIHRAIEEMRDEVLGAQGDNLLAAHLEITKPLREAAEELEKALEGMLNANVSSDRAVHVAAGFNATTALARYRAVKGEVV